MAGDAKGDHRGRSSTGEPSDDSIPVPPDICHRVVPGKVSDNRGDTRCQHSPAPYLRTVADQCTQTNHQRDEPPKFNRPREENHRCDKACPAKHILPAVCMCERAWQQPEACDESQFNRRKQPRRIVIHRLKNLESNKGCTDRPPCGCRKLKLTCNRIDDPSQQHKADKRNKSGCNGHWTVRNDLDGTVDESRNRQRQQRLRTVYKSVIAARRCK